MYTGDKMEVSLKRIEANRRNALKNTGAKTQAGKAIAKMNAFKHGLTSTMMVILPGLENNEEWQAHYQGVINSLTPMGTVEMALAERVALILWRLRRLVTYESALISQQDREANENALYRLPSIGRHLFQDPFDEEEKNPYPFPVEKLSLNETRRYRI
jgi:hypothetical protein